MYRVKSEGRNNFQFYSPSMSIKGIEWIMLENKLRRAVENNEFFLHYQPQVDIDTGEVVGVEALVRWRDPERGIVSPGEFIPAAEDTGLIVPIGEQVLCMACMQGKGWGDKGLKPVKIAVNISMRQFKQKDFVNTIDRVLGKTGLDPGRLELEVTESIIMDNTEAKIKTLSELRERGVCLAIDDFGTGYSSMAYLKRMPIQMLKIDQTFVRDILIDENDVSICSAVIRMADGLNLDVISEGVETMGQLELLRELGCRKVQGYVVSKPIPPEELEGFLKRDWRFTLSSFSSNRKIEKFSSTLLHKI